MASLSSLFQLPWIRQSPLKLSRSFKSNFSTFQEGDCVVIHGHKKPLLTKPLRPDLHTHVHRGTLAHADIIGKQPRDKIQAQKGPVYRATHPTLEEYLILTPRLVTPVYPADASLIVSLLDIHAVTSNGDDSEPLELLEAGTGHGSLTLHLSRAISAANSPPPFIPRRRRQVLATAAQSNPQPQAEQNADEDMEAWNAWTINRRAVLHTVDISEAFSARAENVVRGFRRGIYAGNVDFYVAPVELWVDEQIRRRSNTDPFLSYAILDMPAAHEKIERVIHVLKDDGILVVFMPSVTQISECVKLIGEKRLPLMLEKAVELGTGISSGRLWDIRMTKVKRSSAQRIDSGVDEQGEAEESERGEEVDMDAESQSTETERESVLVCRPKVGTKVVGGGFVGLWRKLKM